MITILQLYFKYLRLHLNCSFFYAIILLHGEGASVYCLHCEVHLSSDRRMTKSY